MNILWNFQFKSIKKIYLWTIKRWQAGRWRNVGAVGWCMDPCTGFEWCTVFSVWTLQVRQQSTLSNGAAFDRLWNDNPYSVFFCLLSVKCATPIWAAALCDYSLICMKNQCRILILMTTPKCVMAGRSQNTRHFNAMFLFAPQTLYSVHLRCVCVCVLWMMERCFGAVGREQLMWSPFFPSLSP